MNILGTYKKNLSDLIEQAKEETSKTGFSLKKSKALKQLLSVQEIFDNLRDAWSDIGDLMQAGNVNEQTIKTIENRLTEYAQGGIFSKLISSFKTQPPSGLSVDDIVGNITNHLREVFNENPDQLSQAVANVGNALRGIPSTDAPESAQKAADKGYPGQEQQGAQSGSEDLQKVSQNVTKKLNLGSDQQQNIQGVLQKLQQAGYAVKKS